MAKLQFLQNAGLNISQQHTIHFQSLADQNDFWSSRIITSADVDTENILSRCLEGMPISYGASKQTLLGINYCRLQQDGKWWYFFIENKKYVNDNATNLFVKLDVLQTYLVGIDYTIDESFVQREHQDRINSDKSRKYNIIEESLNYGNDVKLVESRKIYPVHTADISEENIDNYNIYFALISFSPNYVTVTAPTGNADTQYITLALPFRYHPSSVGQVDIYAPTTNNGNFVVVPSIIDLYQYIIAPASSNDIYSFVVMPYPPYDMKIWKDSNDNNKIKISYSTQGLALEGTAVTVTKDGHSFPAYYPSANSVKIDVSSLSNKEYAVDALPNHNNLANIKYESKLFTHPYYYHLLNDSNAEEAMVKQEYLPASNISFEYWNNWTGNIKDGMYVKQYGLGESMQRGFQRLNQMELQRTTSQYAEYLANNKNSMSAGLYGQGITGGLGALSSIGIGIGTGNPLAVVGGILSGVNTITNITNQLAKIKDVKESPDTLKNIGNTTQLLLIEKMIYFVLKTYQITDKFKDILFKYFSRYGYATKEFKAPNINSRYYFNYIQTIGANISANIDNEYITEIKSILDNGVTFWHYRNALSWKGIESYSYENAEMTLDGGV